MTGVADDRFIIMDAGQIKEIVVLTVNVVAQIVLIVRVLTRPHSQPASKVAWIAVVLSIPILGIIAYLAFGETYVGRRRLKRIRGIVANLPPQTDTPGIPEAISSASIPVHYAPLFRVGKSVNGLDCVGGNRGTLLADSNAAIASMAADTDAAKETVHLMSYIWLADNNGCAVVEALIRAADRGVICRVMADGLGSRGIIRSPHWENMKNAGVRLAVALPIGAGRLGSPDRRVDLRNHRKIVVIDNNVTYCGSQNCADPEFRIRKKFAPWVDVMIRFEGPIVRQNQGLFAGDWAAETGENLNKILLEPVKLLDGGFPAMVIATGPTVQYQAMPEMFESLMYAARRKLVISTPYYVPDEPMQTALCASARRGVEASIIFPERNDSWFVGAASRSYYRELLSAGVRIFEFKSGLLHAKTLTVDGEVALIGSANMDRRSFELNYENNIMFYCPELASELYKRQKEYMAESREVTLEMVETWSIGRRLINNLAAIFGPVL